ncbi:MAG: ScyD/ScyE family protein [Gaiellaceae bacterium]
MRRLMFVALAAAAFALPAAAQAAAPEPVMTGLNNPRGLAFGPEGGLYVAEAGKGGSGVCVPGPDGMGTRCYGATGAVSRLWRGTQERIATGLPSLAGQPAGDTAAGPQDVSFQGRGGLYVTIGCSCDRGNPTTGALLDGLGFGYLMHVSASGHAKRLVDIAGYELSANPDGDHIDSNPFGLLALPGHRLVTDAGGNSLLDVAANGSVSTVRTFPKIPVPFDRDVVPTDVVVGPDGAYYVSSLTGFPFTAGTASVYRVVPGQAPTPYATGLTMVTDLAFGPDGSLYTLQHASAVPGVPFPFAGPGAIKKTPPGGGSSSTLVAGDLPRATGLVVGAEGALYVSVNGASSGNGAVWRIVP